MAEGADGPQMVGRITDLGLSGPTLEERVWELERLVLELTKHVPASQSLPVGAVVLIEDLKLRHPDV